LYQSEIKFLKIITLLKSMII